MPANEKELSIILRAKDEASKVLKSISGGFANIASAAISMAQTILKWTALAATAIAALAFKVGKDFEYSLRLVGVTAGATAEELELLEATARDIGATTAFSAKQAADAMYDLASAGLSVEEIMLSAKQAVFLAGATMSDMSVATSLVASSIKIFGLNAGETSRIVDTLFTATNKVLTTLTGMQTAFQFAAPIAASFGYSIEETAAAVAQFLDLGLDASIAGTTFRQMLTNLAKPTDALKENLAAVGLTFNQVNPASNKFVDIMQNLADSSLDANKAVEIFGRTGGSVYALVKAVREGRVDIKAFTEDLRNSAGAAEKAYERMIDTVEGRWQIFKSAVEEILLVINDSFKVSVKDILETAAQFITDLAKIYGAIAPYVAGTIAFISEFAKVAGASLHQYAEGMSKDSGKTIKSAQKLVNAEQQVMLTTVQFVETVTSGIKFVIVAATDAITGFVSGVFAILAEVVNEIVGGILNKLSSIDRFVPRLKPITNVLRGITKSMDEAVLKIAEFSDAQFDDLLGSYDDIIGKSHELSNTLETMFSQIDWGPIITAIEDATNNAEIDINAIINKVIAEMKNALGDLDTEIPTKPKVEEDDAVKRERERAKALADERRRNRLDNLQLLAEDLQKERDLLDKFGIDTKNTHVYYGKEITKELVKIAEERGVVTREAMQEIFANEIDALEAHGINVTEIQRLLNDQLQGMALNERMVIEDQWRAHWEEVLHINEDGSINLAEQTQEMTDLLIDTYNTAFGGIADVVGTFFADLVTAPNEALPNVLKGFAKIVGGIASMWGDFFIKQGIAMIALGVATSNPKQVASGGAMIAGGIGLKALAALLGSVGGGGAEAGRGGAGAGASGVGGEVGRESELLSQRKETRIVVEGVPENNMPLSLTGAQLHEIVNGVNEGLRDGNVVLDYRDYN